MHHENNLAILLGFGPAMLLHCSLSWGYGGQHVCAPRVLPCGTAGSSAGQAVCTKRPRRAQRGLNGRAASPAHPPACCRSQVIVSTRPVSSKFRTLVNQDQVGQTGVMHGHNY